MLIKIFSEAIFSLMVTNYFNLQDKGEQGTAELGANTVLKQTNELCF